MKYKEGNVEDRKEFENALCQLGLASTPFVSPPNGLSPYQITLLIGMALELGLTSFGDVVAGNLLFLEQSPDLCAASVQEIKNYCLKFLRIINYDNTGFWEDVLRSDHADTAHKSIAAEILCNSHPDLVGNRFDHLFSDENPQRGALAWNIFSKVDAKSRFVEHLADPDARLDVELFLDSMDVADPSGRSRSEFESWIGMLEIDNVSFSQIDYRNIVAA